MKTVFRGALCGAMFFALHQVGTITELCAQVLKQFTPYSEARPLFDALRSDLLPAELSAASTRESSWPAWVSQHDAAVRARVAAGDEDTIIHLLFYGTSFTKQPPITEQELAGLLVREKGAESAFIPSPLLKARIVDFIAAIAVPATNERLQFVRQLIDARGFDPTTETGRNRLQRHLEERAAIVGAAERTARFLSPDSELVDKLTIFRDRGLSSDTSIPIDFAVEEALDAMKAKGVVRRGMVSRIAVLGPGLDVVDKQNGFDFYPLQTIQPFAVIDSLSRLGLADPGEVRVTAFDVSSRVLQHLEAARQRARDGMPYSVILPRTSDRSWHEDLIAYWERFGNWIGQPIAAAPVPPLNAGRLAVRGVFIRPEVVLSITPADLNIVTERLEESDEPPFDLIIATNILLYYDVFEQSLASGNIAKMLKPGGFLLTNNRIFELPGSPLSGVGFTDVVYMSLPGVGDTGDRIVWYQKQ